VYGRYVTVTFMTFDKQSNGRRIEVEPLHNACPAAGDLKTRSRSLKVQFSSSVVVSY